MNHDSCPDLDLGLHARFTDEPAPVDPTSDLNRAKAGLRRRRTRLAALIAGAVVVGSASVVAATHQQQVSVVPADPARSRSVTDFQLPPDTDRRLTYNNLVSEPVPNDYPTPLVSKTRAASTVAGGPPRRPVLTLRLVSNNSPSTDPTGTGDQETVGTTPTLYWVAYWANTERIATRPMSPLSASPRPREYLACADITYINATTGRQTPRIDQECWPR